MHGPSVDEDDGPIAAINVIPLVDVMLVLLIIFMVTTVFTRDSAIPLELPKGSRPEQVQTKPVQITVTVQKDGGILLNGKPTALDQLAAGLNSFRDEHGKTLVVVRGDRNAYYGKIMPVLDEISRAGIQVTLALLPGPPDE